MTDIKGAFALGLRELAHVPRWTVARTTRKPSVAEHSYYVAQYADAISSLIEWKGDRWRLLKNALWHDADEIITGDMPGPVKRGMEDSINDDIQQNGDYSELGPHIVKFEDNEYVKMMSEQHFGHLFLSTDPEIAAIVKVADIMDDVAFSAEQIRFGNEWVREIFNNDGARLLEAANKLPGMDDDIKLRSVRAVMFRFMNDMISAKPILPK